MRQRSLTIEEILTELELSDSTQVEYVERFDITILPPDPEYDTDVGHVQDKIVNYTTGVPAKGIITLSILATPIVPRPRSVVPHKSSTVLQEIRYDRKDHWPAKDSSQCSMLIAIKL
ncbi:hypothetical protein C0J52_16331 [Blattella germanica]|nr:hypothetical protein C0J52_16331 [Blattella germanica]